MKRKAGVARFLAWLVTLTLVFAFPALPVLAEDDPAEPGEEETAPVEPVPFTVAGTVVAYNLPGVISETSEADEDGTVALEVLSEDEEEEPAADEPAAGEDPGDEEEPAPADEDEAPGDEEPAPADEDEAPGDEEPAPADEDEAPGDEEPALDGPFITLVNREGEYTFPVTEEFAIEAPQTETGEYILNIGDLVEVSGVDGVVDHIVVVVVEWGGERDLNAAVPGKVEAISASSIVVAAADGAFYGFFLTEATEVRAGPLALSLTDIAVGDSVVVKGDGTGGAAWVRLIGGSVKTVMNRHRHGQPAIGEAKEAEEPGRPDGPPAGRGKSAAANGRGNGRGRGPNR